MALKRRFVPSLVLVIGSTLAVGALLDVLAQALGREWPLWSNIVVCAAAVLLWWRIFSKKMQNHA